MYNPSSLRLFMRQNQLVGTRTWDVNGGRSAAWLKSLVISCEGDRISAVYLDVSFKAWNRLRHRGALWRKIKGYACTCFASRCGTSSNHVALLVSSLFLQHVPICRTFRPVHPFSGVTVCECLSSLDASLKDYAFTSDVGPSWKPSTKAVISSRVTRGNGRKKEGSNRYFQTRFASRRQKRCLIIIP